MDTTRYVRRTFGVEAVQVTENNIEEVARWINPNFKVLGEGSDKYVLVPFKDLKGRPQKTPAYFGNWITRTSEGVFKLYTEKHFHAIFEIE